MNDLSMMENFGEVVDNIPTKTRRGGGRSTQTTKFLASLFDGNHLPEGKAFSLRQSIQSNTYGEAFTSMDDERFEEVAKSISIAIRNQAHRAGFDPTISIDKDDRRVIIIRDTGSNIVSAEDVDINDIPNATLDDSGLIRVPYGTSGKRRAVLTESRLSSIVNTTA